MVATAAQPAPLPVAATTPTTLNRLVRTTSAPFAAAASWYPPKHNDRQTLRIAVANWTAHSADEAMIWVTHMTIAKTIRVCQAPVALLDIAVAVDTAFPTRPQRYITRENYKKQP